DRGSSPVGQEELVARPVRHDELARTRRRQQQPHTRCRLLDGQTLELGTGECDANQARAHLLDAVHLHAPKLRRLAPDLHELIIGRTVLTNRSSCSSSSATGQTKTRCTPACANEDSVSAKRSGGPTGRRSRRTSSGRLIVGTRRSRMTRSASFAFSVT